MISKGFISPDSRLAHGISTNPTIQQVEGSILKILPSSPRKKELYAELFKAFTGKTIVGEKKYRLGKLMPQILFGHRVWCVAANESERFLSINELQYVVSDKASEAWIRLQIDEQEVSKLHLTHKELLSNSRLKNKWKIVRQSDTNRKNCLCIEQISNTSYSQRPGDALRIMSENMRQYLWCSVLLHPPYRKYYLYIAPNAERNSVLPQLLSMYLIIFFLGSITRYQPHHFDRLLDTDYGAHLIGAISEIPNQFIYLMASEILGREVTRASLA